MAGLLTGLLGIVVLLGLAWLISGNRKAINLRIVGAAFALQALVAAFVIYTPAGRAVIETMSDGVLKVMGYSRDGIEFVFGGLATTEGICPRCTRRAIARRSRWRS